MAVTALLHVSHLVMSAPLQIQLSAAVWHDADKLLMLRYGTVSLAKSRLYHYGSVTTPTGIRQVRSQYSIQALFVKPFLGIQVLQCPECSG